MMTAGLLAGAAALSLPLGALIAIVRRPSARRVAVIMAFGSGALIHAVVTELATNPATELVTEHGLAYLPTWSVISSGFFLGGLLYVGVNLVVERFGGGLHRRQRVRSRALAEKRAQLAPLIQALAETEIAQCLAPEDVEEVLPFLRAIEVEPGDVIYRPGDVSDALYVVQRGACTVHYANNTDAAAEATTVLKPGDVVGGLGMIGGEPRTGTLVADEAGVLLTLTRADFDQVMRRVPRLRATVTDMVARHLFVSAQASGHADAAAWYRTAVGSLQNLSRAETVAVSKHDGGSPFAIFIGTLQDGLPESVAIGASFTTLAAFNPTFLVAVLLSNLPEAVAGTSALIKAGFSAMRVWLMWTGLVVASVAAGALGHAALYGASPVSVAFLEAFAGGGVVAMLATTMMPEAYEEGGSGVVPATIAGFLASLLLSILELEIHTP